MKKMVFVLILAILAAGSIFAQADVKTHWASGEINILGVGARYEYMLLPNFSVGVNTYSNAGIMTGGNVFSIVGSYYPWAKKLYVDLGLGFGSVHSSGSVTLIEKETGVESTYGGTTTTGFVITPGLGWKIDVGSPGGFFIQPGLRIPIAIGKQTPNAGGLLGELVGLGYNSSDFDVKSQTGAGTTFIVYFNMGFAF